MLIANWVFGAPLRKVRFPVSVSRIVDKTTHGQWNRVAVAHGEGELTIPKSVEALDDDVEGKATEDQRKLHADAEAFSTMANTVWPASSWPSEARRRPASTHSRRAA